MPRARPGRSPRFPARGSWRDGPGAAKTPRLGRVTRAGQWERSLGARRASRGVRRGGARVGEGPRCEVADRLQAMRGRLHATGGRVPGDARSRAHDPRSLEHDRRSRAHDRRSLEHDRRSRAHDRRSRARDFSVAVTPGFATPGFPVGSASEVPSGREAPFFARKRRVVLFAASSGGFHPRKSRVPWFQDLKHVPSILWA